MPKERMDPDAYRAFGDCGCKAWSVDADTLEDRIKDLIVSERGSDQFAAELKAIILERESFESSATRAVQEARARVAELEAQDKKIAGTMATLAASPGFDPTHYVDQVRQVQARLTTARTELVEAERFAESRSDVWSRIQVVLGETRALAEGWPHLAPEEKNILLDYWVLDVVIVVQPHQGMKRANTKTAIVTLRTAPNTPRFFNIEREECAPPHSGATDRAESVALPLTPDRPREEKDRRQPGRRRNETQ